MANYRGTENVEFIWNGTQSDPQLLYDGKLFNYWDIEDALWEMFTEDNPDVDVSGEWADDSILADARSISLFRKIALAIWKIAFLADTSINRQEDGKQ